MVPSILLARLPGIRSLQSVSAGRDNNILCVKKLKSYPCKSYPCKLYGRLPRCLIIKCYRKIV